MKAKINTRLIQGNFDDVLRLAHSIREGKVSGSLIMSKIGSYARQNKLAAALKEMGKIEKTIFSSSITYPMKPYVVEYRKGLTKLKPQMHWLELYSSVNVASCMNKH